MKQKLKKDIGIKLRRFRKSLHFTQADMVVNFDVGRANYSRIEKGEVFPNAAILHTLKTKFNLSLNWLISTEKETDDDQMLLNKKQQKITLDVSEDNREIEKLIHYMGKIPMIRHAVLGFFMEYRMKNDELITKLFAEIAANEQKKSANVENEDFAKLGIKS
ncbi:MAG: helix-turn-helix transcriptional regulator [Candidatus Aminicenantes bacterium]|nr:helix-turn-helix transcriptional regulator [Candidatus Aminicenantes bacterium]